jgi:CBS domain-containing protein
MCVLAKALQDMTAADLMTREVVVLPQGMPFRDAARQLLQTRTSGAPVVDRAGRCVGVLSATDFLREAANCDAKPHSSRRRGCSFQTDCRLARGEVVTLCTLAPGACPVQGSKEGTGSEGLLICREPKSVLTDWQIVEMESLPEQEVGEFMTPDPVMTEPETSIRVLARMMIDAHIHRVIVVDAETKPIGIVSSTDLLAALAYSDAGTPVH